MTLVKFMVYFVPNVKLDLLQLVMMGTTLIRSTLPGQTNTLTRGLGQRYYRLAARWTRLVRFMAVQVWIGWRANLACRLGCSPQQDD